MDIINNIYPQLPKDGRTTLQDFQHDSRTLIALANIQSVGKELTTRNKKANYFQFAFLQGKDAKVYHVCF